MLNNFASDSSIHGIKFIFSEDHNKYGKIFFTILLLASICGFSFYIINAYSRWQIIPDVAMRQEQKNINDYPIPAITICPRYFGMDNLSNFSSFFNDDEPKENTVISKEGCENTAANMIWCEPGMMEKIYSVCEPYSEDIEDINALELVNKTAFKYNEFFKYTDIPFLRIFTYRGICFTSNMQDSTIIFNQHKLHEDFDCFRNHKYPEFNWTVENGYFHPNASYPYRLIPRGDFNIQMRINKVDGENSCGSFYFILHLPSEIPTPFHNFIPVGYGSKTSAKLVSKSHRTDNGLRKFPPKIRNCYFDGEKKLKFFKSYSKAHCQLECFVEATLKVCGCVLFWMPRNKTTRLCRYSELRCTNKLHYEDSSSCDCLPTCNDIKYETNIYLARNRKLMTK